LLSTGCATGHRDDAHPPRNARERCPTPVKPTWGPPPPFDAACRAAYEALPAGIPRMDEDVMRKARSQPGPSLADLTLNGAFEVSEATGSGVPLVIARPTAAGPVVPVIYLLHPGGMVLGDRFAGALPVLGLLAQPLGLALVSAGYRLAPEAQAPQLAEDCFAGLTWLADNAKDLGIDGDRIILMGISGGGGLAASCGLMARDRGGPRLLAQLLMYPMLDDRNDTPSSHQMADVGIWRKADNEFAWRKVLGERFGTDRVTAVDAAARAEDLSGLPPTFLDSGNAEIFRDEIVDYARRIWLAGGTADLHVWGGGFHGFDLVGPATPLGAASWQAKRDWIERQLNA
jgi:acetyl esterase/lipase